MDEDTLLRVTGDVCLEALETMVHESVQMNLSRPSELLARFNVWADEVGLFTNEDYSFDSQVRHNRKVYIMVRQFLDAIRTDAELCKTSPPKQVIAQSSQSAKTAKSQIRQSDSLLRSWMTAPARACLAKTMSYSALTTV
jgi:hypothetical protein